MDRTHTSRSTSQRRRSAKRTGLAALLVGLAMALTACGNGDIPLEDPQSGHPGLPDRSATESTLPTPSNPAVPLDSEKLIEELRKQQEAGQQP